MLPVSSADEAEAGGTDEPHLVMVTARGLIKKTCASEFVSIRNNGKKALLLRAGDRLKHVGTVRQGDGILVGGVDGQVIHFDGDSIRPQGAPRRGSRRWRSKPMRRSRVRRRRRERKRTTRATRCQRTSRGWWSCRAPR